jgi:hypothetical protein
MKLLVRVAVAVAALAAAIPAVSADGRPRDYVSPATMHHHPDLYTDPSALPSVRHYAFRPAAQH